MAKFNNWFLQRTSILRIIILIAVSVGLITSFIRGFDPAFQNVTAGHQIIDMQPAITPDSIYAELPDYTAASRQIYTWFMVADFVFPATAALAMAFLWAWLIKVAPNSIYSAVLRIPIFALPLLTTALDWLENVGFLVLIFNYPIELLRVANVASALRQGKVLVMGANMILTLGFIVVTLGLIWCRRHRSTAA